MSKQITDEDKLLWRRLLEAEGLFHNARRELFLGCSPPVLVELVRTGLHNPTERVTALGVVFLLTIEDRKRLFKELLSLASFSHGSTTTARELFAISAVKWLVANIEESAETLLEHDDYEEYRALLQMHMVLDHELARNAA